MLQRLEARKEEIEFENATREQKKAILKKKKQQLMEEAFLKLKKETEKTVAVADSFLNFSKLVVRPLPTASKLRFFHRPTPNQSKAEPLDEGSARVVKPNVGSMETLSAPKPRLSVPEPPKVPKPKRVNKSRRQHTPNPTMV